MRRQVLSGIILIVLLIAGFQFYLWYDTRQLMDRWIARFSPHATVHYRGVHASLLGSLGLNRVRVTMLESDESYLIRSLRLTTGGPLALLRARRALKQNRLPPNLSVTVEGVEMGLFGDASALLSPFSLAQGCGDTELLDSEDFAALGMENINLDLASNLARRNDELFVDLSVFLDGIADLHLETRLILPSEGLDGWAETPPVLTELQLAVADQGFNQEKIRYCAERLDTSPVRFIGQHMQALGAALETLGIAISEDLANGYARFLAADRGHLTFHLQPDRAWAPNLEVGAWLRLIQQADSELIVNERAMTNLDIELDPTLWQSPSAPDPVPPSPDAVVTAPEASATSGTVVASAEPEKAASSTVARRETPSTPAEASTYRALPPEQLDQHIGRRVIVDTVNGNQHQGVIEGFEQGRLTVRIPLQNGSVAIPIRSEGIARIQVQME